jgi:hypothetical protein
MKRIGWLFLILSGSLSFAQTASPQVQHAPTFEACDADLRLWTAQIPGYPNSSFEQGQEGTKLLTATEMYNRISYINECAQAYPVFYKSRNANELPGTLSLVQVYIVEIAQRHNHFLERHALSAKFQEEDEAGKR